MRIAASTPSRRAEPGHPTAHRTGRGWLFAAGASLVGFVLILSLVVTTHGTDRLDTAVSGGTAGLRMTSITTAAHLVTLLGSFPVVVAVAVLAAGLLWLRTRGWLAPAVLLTSVVATAGVVFLVKIAVGRARPSITHLLGTPSADYAFPSGHTTNGTVVYLLAGVLLAATLQHPAHRRLVVAATMLVGLAIGVTRVYLGYHWTTDVLAGWLLATSVVCTAAYAFALLGPRPTGPAPAA